MSNAAKIALQRSRVVASINRLGGVEAGILKEVLAMIDAAVSEESLNDAGVRKISKQVTIADLVVAATTSVVAMDDEIPAGATIVAASVDLPTDFSGGAVSAMTVDVGDADPNLLLTLVDIFTAAGPLVESQLSPGVAFDGTSAGQAIMAAATTLDLLFTSTTADLDALTAGDCTVNVYYTVPRVKE